MREVCRKAKACCPPSKSLRIPVQYLANMLSAGDTGPVLAGG
ncbi:Respiratory nitrate reductase 2 beta chain [Escherichia coli]|uniref:Respiratory nitrate reductase 2 beta chain n=1 Tax=Escherichia coli TaxID=562 RepID=A0A377K771_ECOLX|nr:Respiratory nitrate reductase 2 beta chain [Escherichia coli]